MKEFRIILPVIIVLLCAEPALAIDMEFYTYGGFVPVTGAFNKIALIFSDSSYTGLIFVVTVLGLVAGATAHVIQAATGARIVPLVWAVPVLIGAVVYLSMFVPKGTITVYDPILNRFQMIGNIPDAIVFTAGFLNKVEKGMVDIIDTAAVPEAQYQANAGGMGFKALEAVKNISPKDANVKASMVSYIKDCVTFELTRPGTTLTLDDLKNTSTDFLIDLGKAVNPMVYTRYFDTLTPEGINITCTEAWNRLRPLYANPAFYDDAIKAVCSKAFFDPASQAEITTCKTLLTDTLNYTTGTATTPEKLIQQRQIAEILYDFYFKEDYETAMLMEADRKIVSTGLGVGLTMNEWIPILRAIMTAVAIGVIPFLVLFLPTPIAGKAASVMVGFFIFLTTWGITDAVIHGAAMDYAVHVFEDMRQSHLGVYACAAFPTTATKMLAMFGVIRSAGIMLASFFAMMLIRFGGHALAMLAGNLSGIVQGAGSQAGQLLTPEGMSTAMNQQIRAAGMLDGIAEHRFTNMAAAEAWNRHRSVGGYMAAMNAKGALQESGRIDHEVSNGSMATMMAAANMSVGTARGPVLVSTAPDGHGTRIQSETVNTDGSTTTETTGAEGTGVAVDKSAHGSATYSTDSTGRMTTTQASVNGLDPVKVGAMAQHQMISAASSRLGSDTGWNTTWQQLQKDSLTSSEARSFSNTLNNRIMENWKRAINDQSSFVHTMDETSQTAFQAAVNAGLSDIIGASGSGTITVVGKDGEKVNFTLSEDTARTFMRDQARVRSEAFRQTLQDSNSLDYMTQIAKRVGATEAYSYLRDAKQIESASESYGVDLTTALVRNYAKERYGDETPDNIRRTIKDFNEFLTQQGSQGIDSMQGIIRGFVSGGGYGWGRTADEVQNSIDSTRGLIDTGMAHSAGGVNQAAATASASTSGIHQGSFGEPKSEIGMDEPSGDMALRGADRVRQFNTIEESGQGRIRTSMGGMTSEAIGHGPVGLVDSQPDKLDNEAIYYETSKSSDGMVPPQSVAIQKGEPSFEEAVKMENKK